MDKFQILFEISKIYSSNDIRKEFSTQEFLGQVSISTSKNAKLKNYIVKVLNELKDLKVI